jgi:hypothetical protein
MSSRIDRTNVIAGEDKEVEDETQPESAQLVRLYVNGLLEELSEQLFHFVARRSVAVLSRPHAPAERGGYS